MTDIVDGAMAAARLAPDSLEHINSRGRPSMEGEERVGMVDPPAPATASGPSAASHHPGEARPVAANGGPRDDEITGPSHAHDRRVTAQAPLPHVCCRGQDLCLPLGGID